MSSAESVLLARRCCLHSPTPLIPDGSMSSCREPLCNFYQISLGSRPRPAFTILSKLSPTFTLPSPYGRTSSHKVRHAHGRRRRCDDCGPPYCPRLGSVRPPAAAAIWSPNGRYRACWLKGSYMPLLQAISPSHLVTGRMGPN